MSAAKLEKNWSPPNRRHRAKRVQRLVANVIADLGFEAIYITSAGVTNMSVRHARPGLHELAEIADHTARIRDAVDVPLLVDAPIPASAARSTSITRCARWSVPGQIAFNWKTRWRRSAAVISPARM